MKRILIGGDTSTANSGFAVYKRNILSGLMNAGFQVAEVGNGGTIADQARVPWKYYPTGVAGDDPRIKEYRSNPANEYGGWRWENIAIHYKPTHYCLKAGELVLTDTGYKPIEKISLGERVLTCSGVFKRVTKLYKNEHNGDMINLLPNGDCTSIKTTPNHPIWGFKKKKRIGDRTYAYMYSGEPDYVDSGNMYSKDILALPKIKHIAREVKTIDVRDYLVNYKVDEFGMLYPKAGAKKIVKKIAPEIALDKNFFSFLGYLFASGFFNQTTTCLFIKKNCFHFLDEIKNVMGSVFGLEVHTQTVSEKECVILHINSSLVSEFFKKLTKNVQRIPDLIWESSEQEKIWFLSAFLKYRAIYSRNTISCTFLKQRQVYDYKMLFISLNIPVNITNIKGEQFRKKYRLSGYGDSAIKLHNITQKYSNIEKYEFTSGGIRVTHDLKDKMIYSVKTRRITKYNGVVYNLQVEDDHSYVTTGAGVHNCDCGDPWQFSHVLMSPLRPYYSIIAAPTVDSIPQRQDFLQMFSQVDHLYAYTEWAKDYLNDNNLNCLGTFGMGIDPNVMKPLDKKELRAKYKVPADAIIFGFVARNQLRKRFPELIKAFNLYLKKASPEIAKRSYLYLHTSSPDAGWNFATHLLDGNVINKVLFTYMCRKTGEIFCTTYKDDRTYSPFSGEMTAFMPNVVYSPTLDKLNEVYNLFDYYVQCANREGLGYPQIEAAASNIPIIATNYSAMAELTQEFGGLGINSVLNFDSNVMADYAAIDPEAWSEALLKYALEKPVVNSRLTVLEKYTWSHIVNKIITAIDQADPPKERWDAPIKQYGFPPIKGDMTATQFIHLLSSHIPTLKWSPYNLLSMRSINTQLDLRGKQLMTVTPEIIAQRYQEIINRINQVERLRCGVDPLPDEDYLK